MTKEKDDLDLDQLRRLLDEVNKLELLNHNVRRFKLPICKFIKNGRNYCELPIFVHDKNSKNKETLVANNLLNYIKDNVIPPNSNENVTIFYNILIDILFDKLKKSEIKRKVENENDTTPYLLNQKQLSEVIESQVELCKFKKNGITKVKLISTICPIEMQDFKELIFVQNDKLTVKIREWSETERAIFASEISWKNLGDLGNKSPMNLKVFAEIEYTFSKDEFDIYSNNKYREYIFGLLDLIKWTLMILSKNPYPIREGTCFLNLSNPQHIEIFKRDYNNLCLTVNNGHSSHFSIYSEMENRARELFDDFQATLKEFKELIDALHFFGRACIAAQYRDKLIDSVIGLEIILVQGHEQLGYQFRLHGATVFSTQWDESKISIFEGENELFWKKENLVNWFRDTYGKRSTSVHGSKNEYTENDVAQALYSLAVIIKGIIYLHNKGLLYDKKNKLSRAVKNYVIDKSVLKNVD